MSEPRAVAVIPKNADVRRKTRAMVKRMNSMEGAFPMVLLVISGMDLPLSLMLTNRDVKS